MTVSNVSEELLFLRKRARRRLVGAVALVLFALVVLWTVLDNTPPAQLATGQTIEITSSSPALASVSAPVVAVVEASSASMVASAVVATNLPAAPAQSGSSPVVASSAVASPVMPAASQPQTVAKEAVTVESVLPGKLVNHQTQVSVETKKLPKVSSKPEQIAASKPKSDPRRILEGLDNAESGAVQKYFLQVGAFADAAKAAQIVTKLKGTGLPAYAEKVNTANGQLTRVRVGPSTSEARANEWRKKSESAGVPGKVIRQ